MDPKMDPKNDPFFGHFLGHFLAIFWSRNDQKVVNLVSLKRGKSRQICINKGQEGSKRWSKNGVKNGPIFGPIF